MFLLLVVPDPGDTNDSRLVCRGTLKTASLENPQFFGRVILVPSEISTEELGRRLQQEKGGRVEPLVRYQQEARQVLSWTELAEVPLHTEEAFRDAGVYLITGGLGRVGCGVCQRNSVARAFIASGIDGAQGVA